MLLEPQTSEFPYAPILNEALPKDGLVLGAHVFADTDNVCYDVGIYADDTYLVISCLVDFTYPAPSGMLDTNTSAFLQRWLERFTGYEENSRYNHHTFVIFKGNGTITPDFAEKIGIEHLIGNLEWKAHAYVSGGGTPSAVPAAQRVLGEKIGMSPEAITVLKFEAVDFPNSCLGTPKPKEVCVQVVTQGFRIQLVALGLLYEYHTDAFGFDIRPFGDPQAAPTQGAGG
jgi:hypothetical protein